MTRIPDPNDDVGEPRTVNNAELIDDVVAAFRRQGYKVTVEPAPVPEAATVLTGETGVPVPDKAERLRARIAELEAVLTPFAEMAEAMQRRDATPPFKYRHAADVLASAVALLAEATNG